LVAACISGPNCGYPTNITTVVTPASFILAIKVAAWDCASVESPTDARLKNAFDVTFPSNFEKWSTKPW
jgi:hypothetical protein